ncbi:MAG TPA: hypothetical protein VFV68_11800 [Agriterribacter sp.]|nr:hypothetical protein [Agriterribacter sp.]
MNTRILFMAAAVIGLGSCSTMYRSGQTPDDVYFSPAPAYQQRVASSNDNNNDENTDGNDTNEYLDVQTEQDRSAYNSEDNYLRMKVRNPSLWSSIDYMYSPYSYGTGFSFGMGYYNPYSFNQPYFDYAMGFGWGGIYSPFYNPYYGFYHPWYGYGGYYGHSYYPGGVYGKPGTIKPEASYSPRTTNLGSYGRTRNAEFSNSANKPVRVFGNSNNNNYVNPRSSSGSTSPRRTFNTEGNNSRPSRTFDNNSSNSSPRYSPSSNSGSSGNRSSGGGGSAPSRAPGRGGR